MSVTRIDRTNYLSTRLELLRVAEQRLRQNHPLDANHLFEVQRAIDALTAEDPTSLVETCERWARTYVYGPEVG